MEFIPLIAMLALVAKVIDFIKFLKNGDTNAWFTQLSVWVGGVVVVLLFAQTQFADGIAVGDMSLSTLNFASLIAVGLSVGSLSSLAIDAKKAIDGGDTAKTPPLLGE